MKLIGDGGWRELSPKRYELWQFVEVDGIRKQKTKRVKCGKRELGEALRAFQGELADQLPPSDSFAAYAASWCAYRRESGTVAPSTCLNNESMVRAFAPCFDCPITDVTPQMCRDAMIALKAERGWSGTTAHTKHVMLHGLFSQAVKDGVMKSNPLDAVDAPAIDTKEREAMSPAELDALWCRVSEEPLSSYTMALFLAMDAGFRIGECVWLEAKGVGETSVTLARSKTKAGVRTVPMTDRLKAKCREWERDRADRGIADAETFCCRLDGLPLKRSSLRNWYVKNRERLGLPQRFHDIRHANLSKMARYMSAHDLQRWAGWGSIQMANRYVHDDYSQLEAAISRMQMLG